MLAIELNLVGKLIYNSLYSWVKTWSGSSELIGTFAITVIIFTLFLKVATLPLDFWQKQLGRKNARKMEMMKPELDKINKQCGDNKELLMQKQRAVHRQFKYNAFGACLPTIFNLIIFGVVLSGFNVSVRYHNYNMFELLSQEYSSTYQATTATLYEDGDLSAEDVETATRSAEEAVLALYEPEKFLLTTNVFMADTWKHPIPTIKEFAGRGMGDLNIPGIDTSEYQKVMKPIIEAYNFNSDGKATWNGYLILPILSFVLSLLSAKLFKPPEQPVPLGQTEEQAQRTKSQAKMMQYLMPIMMGIFPLFYSTAFAIYMVVSNMFTTILNIIYNFFSKRADAKYKDMIMSTTIKS